MVCEIKRINHCHDWCSVGIGKSQPAGAPLNTNDGFFLSHILCTKGGKDKKQTTARQKKSDVIFMLV